MSYRILTLDRSTAFMDPVRIVDIGQIITEVDLLDLPTGESIQLAFGDGPLFTVAQNMTFSPRGADDQQRGLYWANPTAVPGETVHLIVSSGRVIV